MLSSLLEEADADRISLVLPSTAPPSAAVVPSAVAAPPPPPPLLLPPPPSVAPPSLPEGASCRRRCRGLLLLIIVLLLLVAVVLFATSVLLWCYCCQPLFCDGFGAVVLLLLLLLLYPCFRFCYHTRTRAVEASDAREQSSSMKHARKGAETRPSFFGGSVENVPSSHHTPARGIRRQPRPTCAGERNRGTLLHFGALNMVFSRCSGQFQHTPQGMNATDAIDRASCEKAL